MQIIRSLSDRLDQSLQDDFRPVVVWFSLARSSPLADEKLLDVGLSLSERVAIGQTRILAFGFATLHRQV